MEIVLTSLLALLGMVFLMNANPLLTVPTWIMVSVFIGSTDVLSALPVIAAAVMVSSLGRYTLAHFSKPMTKHLLSAKQKKNVKFINKFLDKDTGMTWPFMVSFLYALSPLPTNALFIIAGIGRLRMMSLLAGFFLGEFLSNIAYISILAVSLSSVQCIILGLIGLVITIAIIFVDWEKFIKSFMKRELKKRVAKVKAQAR
jgi:hypothetical protein